MADNIDKPQGGEADKSQGDTGQAQGASISTADAALLKKIDDLERDNKKYRDERKAQDAAAKKAQEEHLANQQKWQELAESRAAELAKLQPVAEQYETITAAFNASLDSRLKQIPDDVRKKTVDPVRAALTPADFSNWLDANLDLLRNRKAPPLDEGAGGASGGAGSGRPAAQPTKLDYEMAAAFRITNIQDYMKYKAEMERERANPTSLDLELRNK